MINKNAIIFYQKNMSEQNIYFIVYPQHQTNWNCGGGGGEGG